ncbi:MAG: IPT/TIG domain-containing protein [Rhodococcus sp. (in: high G+C Gram-positive bacteria)]
MADVSVSNPRATGTFFVALPGAVEPTDAVSPLGNLFADHGNVGESGIVRSVARDVQKKKNFGGKTVATMQNDYTETYQLTLLDDYNGTVLKSVFGEENVVINVDGFPEVVDSSAAVLPRGMYVIDTLDGERRLKRKVLFDAQVTTVGDITEVHTDTVEYQITIEVFEVIRGGKGVFTREFRSPALGGSGVPVIQSIVPATVPLSGALIQVNGTRFNGVTEVTIDGADVDFNFITANKIVVDAPSDTAGTVDLVVTNATGASDAFDITYA